MSRRFLVLLTFVILLAVPALAQVQPIESCTVIDKPGSYVLTKDITATMADLKTVVPDGWFKGCIVIVADFVSLDLQGHTITGPGIQGTWNISGIYTTADARGKQATAARVMNGCIADFDFGVGLEGTGHVVEQMRVTRNMQGICFATHGSKCYGIKVKDVVAVANKDAGIFSYGGYGNSVENCQLVSNGVSGLYQHESLPDNERPLGTRIAGNTVAGNGTFGIRAFCPSVILQNMAYGNGSGPQDDILVVATPGLPCVRSDNNPEP